MTSPPHSTDHGWHELIEHYTPEGTFGRVLFGFIVGSVSMFLGVLGFAGMVNTFGVLPFLLGIIGTAIGLAGAGIAITALWPVYLSLIDNIDSPASYGVGSGIGSGTFDGADDPESILKQRYAAGEITREEFERRLDGVMETSDSRAGMETSETRHAHTSTSEVDHGRREVDHGRRQQDDGGRRERSRN
jgi:uncharacterized membrane protein